ncbi:bifunctional diaminohydroxyphosphoribosylaminopyrimidine deaminase/5-amino-6-(5-phosphoribosylamino)uracil reductase RibD [Chitinophagaceae bacterium LY-5]|uniref:Riboflavin biosynthesis protein RibD n=2 Tax=Polluticaenibacter yanchengensis TaxID=3014562 RepID=A0ABT4ULC8_9BACT|nr:bifunctional diaminohydroxyphosphoribosylaminopyrimidine deaminase/5-amino-6-(5-phosphoribosylamino)uracil reductase RibD [Chitinophagaceae bacterium LY-5]
MNAVAHEIYMRRCIELARKGLGKVAPNPMVGAVLVHNNRIIGEGYHQEYGKAHAEVNCINSVSADNKYLIADSTIYVSLEPCAHYGKTPPCADLIVASNIKKVVIGCADPFEAVNGKGIAILKNAGIDVITGVLETECKKLIKRFTTYHLGKRPYIVLKWAESNDGIIAKVNERTAISNALSNRLVHRWRSEEQAILVGTNTAIIDNPKLNSRLFPGRDPLRIVIDRQNKLDGSNHLLSDDLPTIVLNDHLNKTNNRKQFIAVDASESESAFLEKSILKLYEAGITSILVEGGAKTLQSFIDAGLWDEARVITNATLNLQNGIDAPRLLNSTLIKTLFLDTDRIQYYTRSL